MKKTFKHSIASVSLILSSLFLGVGGCSAQDSPLRWQAAAAQNKIQNANTAQIQKKKYKPDAHGIYVFLLFNRALQNRDKQGVLVTVKELTKMELPAFVYLDAGLWAIDNKEKSVIPFLQRGLEQHPSNVALHMLYAEILQRVGKNKEAISHIKDFIAAYPENIDGRVELAILLINDKNFAEAEKILHNLDDAHRTGHVNYYYAKALLGLNRRAEAKKYLEKTVTELPNFMEALTDLGFLYEQENNFIKAREVYEKMLKNYSKGYEVVLRLIMLSLELKEPEKALEYFENTPMTPELNVTVASMFVDAGYSDIAEPILLGLADVQDAPQELYFYLAAIAYERDKDLKKAYKWLTNIDKNNKAYSRALLLRMQLLLDLEQLDEALRDSREGQFAMPNDPDFWLAEIRILATQGKFKEATKNVDIIHKKWPTNTEVAFLRASLFDQSNRKKEALQAMEEIIRLDPNHAQALNYVGYSLAEQNKDIKRALQLLYKAVELSPSANYILDSLAWALYQDRNYKEAWRYIQEAVRVSPVHDSVIWEHYADIARALGKKKEARTGYEKALEFNPKNADAIKIKLKKI